MYRLIIFLVINFAALAVGGLFTSDGVSSDWYSNLNKAPWTPPGWAFGAAWSTIMICFSVYLTTLWPAIKNKKRLLLLFAVQLALNITWNPIFFYFQWATVGMLCISLLTVLIGYILFNYAKTAKLKTLLIAPYFIWLLIATSLNGYILICN